MSVNSSYARLIVGFVIVIATIGFAVAPGEAHKPITSKYNYNDDVFPIFRDKCGRCHVDGGVAPMSLMTYDQAFPWAESIRMELIAGHMPPWNAQSDVGAFKHARLLTANEIDTVLTWATGGNPRGQLGQEVPKVTLRNDWTIGAPDLKLVLPAFSVAADKMEDTKEFIIAAGNKEDRWVRAVDLLPGTPSVVRSAVIAIKGEDDVLFGPERILRQWLPGQDLESVDLDGAAFKLPAHAELIVRVHYKKTWQFEGKTLQDVSTVGVYFTLDKRVENLLAVPISAPAGIRDSGQRVTFTQTIDRDVRALALSSEQMPPNITFAAFAIGPEGTRTPLIRVNTRADWDRCYWFAKPITMRRGTTIEVSATLEDPDSLSAAAFGGIGSSKPPTSPLVMRLSLDVVPLTLNIAEP